MDRTGWFFVILATIGLVITLWWQQQQATELRARQQQQQLAQAASPTATATPSVAATPVAPAQPVPEQRPMVPDQEATLKSAVATLHFSNNRGGLSSVELLRHKAENDQPVLLNTPTAPAIGAITQSPNDWNDSGYQLSSDAASGTATLKRSTSENVEITKIYTLGEKAGLQDEHQTKLSITFKNNGNSEFKTPGYFVSTGGAQQIHSTDRSINTQFIWYREGKSTAIDVNWFNPRSFLFFQTGPGQDFYVQSAAKILWAAVSNQYFTTILAPTNDAGTQVWATRVTTPPHATELPVIGIQGALEVPGFTLAPEETRTIDFSIYSGPKEYGRLARLPNEKTDVMNFGFFKWISVLLLTSLNTLHAWVGSYALAIIILTLIIRSLLWPVQNAATKSMRKMAKLSPLINDLREKYKDDPQRLNQETMKLYKEYGVNPFGGCLPMLIQIPIFFGFYGMLDKAIELRNSTFLWVRDLSQPDTVFHLAGFPINILPLVMAATSVLQISLTPKTGDPAQQRILLFTPVIFLVFCYNYASALALYWTVQNLFFIGQMLLTRNQAEPQLVKVAKPTAVAKRKATDKDNCWTTPKLALTPTLNVMEAKEILDTMLGYLGFVTEIQEIETEGGRQLQVFTAQSEFLIGHNGATLEDLQFLLNRILQSQDRNAPRVQVDVGHWRAMRDDQLRQRVRQIADTVRISGRPVKLEPMNSYDRRIVHNLLKDDPYVMSFSPNDDARIKRITIQRRPKSNPQSSAQQQ